MCAHYGKQTCFFILVLYNNSFLLTYFFYDPIILTQATLTKSSLPNVSKALDTETFIISNVSPYVLPLLQKKIIHTRLHLCTAKSYNFHLKIFKICKGGFFCIKISDSSPIPSDTLLLRERFKQSYAYMLNPTNAIGKSQI